MQKKLFLKNEIEKLRNIKNIEGLTFDELMKISEEKEDYLIN